MVHTWYISVVFKMPGGTRMALENWRESKKRELCWSKQSHSVRLEIILIHQFFTRNSCDTIMDKNYKVHLENLLITLGF